MHVTLMQWRLLKSWTRAFFRVQNRSQMENRPFFARNNANLLLKLVPNVCWMWMYAHHHPAQSKLKFLVSHTKCQMQTIWCKWICMQIKMISRKFYLFGFYFAFSFCSKGNASNELCTSRIGYERYFLLVEMHFSPEAFEFNSTLIEEKKAANHRDQIATIID